MKEFTLKRDSWHYKIAGWMDRIPSETNICDYLRAFIINGIILLMMGSFLIGFCVVLPLIGLINLVGMWLFNMPWYDVSAMGLSILATEAMVTGLVASFIFYSKRDRKEEEPGFVKLSYMKVKNKTCVKINLI